MKRKRKVLSLWATLILVFVGFLVVGGITALVVYFTKGRGDGVMPENISVSLSNLPEEKMAYEEKTLVNGQERINYYVSEDFKLTITTDTEDVTHNKISLSLGNFSPKDGYISNGIIKIKQNATIGEAFDVVLEKTYNAQAGVDVVVGGLSTITATSENLNQRPLVFNVYVDVPVNSIHTGILNGNDVQEGNDQTAIVGEEFKLKTMFTPSTSENVYKKASEVKEIIYEIPTSSSAPIERDWENDKFIAKKTTSGVAYTVVTKTFLNSYYRKQALDYVSARGIDINKHDLAFNDAVSAYFRELEASGTRAYVQDELHITVNNVTINPRDFQINTNSNYSLKFDKETILHARNGEFNLGLSIKYGTDAQNVQEQFNMYSNVGILLDQDVSDWLSITGGNVMKVEFVDDVQKITQLSYNEYLTDRQSATGEVYYYVLPNKSQPDPRDYFWTFSAEETRDNQNQSFEIETNLFYLNDEGKWTTLLDVKNSAAESEKNQRKVTITVGSSSNEEAPTWATREGVSLVIRYNSDGRIDSTKANQDLSLLLGEIKEDNVYRQVVYFIISQDGSRINDLDKVFNIKDADNPYENDYLGEPLSIWEISNNGGYYLYEIKGTTLQAFTSYSDQLYIVAATIKTKADGTTPYYDEESPNHYKIVKFSTPKPLTVSSMLSITNMTPTFKINSAENYYVDAQSSYKIPSILRDGENKKANVLKLYLDVKYAEGEREEDVITKIQQAQIEGTLKLISPIFSGDEISEFVSMGMLSKSDELVTDPNVVRMEADLIINEDVFNRMHSSSFGDEIKLDLKLFYDDGDIDKKASEKEKVVVFEDSNVNQADEVYIYYPNILSSEQIEPEYAKGNVDSKNIEVKVEKNGVSITWDGHGNISSISDLNRLLTFTLKDQYQKEIKSSGAYRVELFECKDDGDYTPAEKTHIGLADANQIIANFPSTGSTSVTTYLSARVFDIIKDQFVQVGGDEIHTEMLTFNISSEGVSKILYSKNANQFEGGAWANSDYSDVENDEDLKTTLSDVYLTKIISGNDTTNGRYLNLNNLIRVWTGDKPTSDDDSNYVNNNANPLMFKFSSLTNYDLEQLTLLMSFRSTTENPQNNSGIIDAENLVGANVQQLVLTYALGQKIDLQFVVTDENESFQIYLTVSLLPDISPTPNFMDYYETYQNYLVSRDKDNLQTGVFGGQKFLLNDYTNGFKSNYDWNNISYSDSDLYKSTGGLEIVSEENKTYLTTPDVYQLTTASLTIYYGVKSIYAMQMTLSLYINPNYVIVENREKVDLKNLNNEKFLSKDNDSTHFLYKAVGENGYLTDKANAKKLDFSDLKGIQFKFIGNSLTPYLTLDAAGKYMLAKSETLNLSLDSKFVQNFKIMYAEIGAGGQPSGEYAFNAIKIVGDAVTKPINKTGGGANESDFAFEFDIDMVYGAQPQDLIKVGDSTTISTVLYDGITKVIILEGKDYLGNNVSIEGVTGQLSRFNDQIRISSSADILSLEGNSINISSIVDNNNFKLQIFMTIQAITSRIGSVFVDYGQGANTFGDYDLKYLLGNNISEISAEFNAGASYDLIHFTPDSSILGFYSSKFGDNSWQHTLTLVNDPLIPSKDVDKNEYAEIQGTKLIINNLESTQEDVYITLRMTIFNASYGTVSWLYRIHVNPSFVKGEANYPFAAEGEYLDESSAYYKDGEFIIDLNEEYGIINSNRTEFEEKETRFKDPTKIELDPIGSVTYKYVIKDEDKLKIKSYYFTDRETLVDGKLETKTEGDEQYRYLHIILKNSTDSFELNVVKTFVTKISVDEALIDTKLVGGDIEYKLLFNKGDVYSQPQLNRSQLDGSTTNVKKEENKYVDQIVYNPSVVSGAAENDYKYSIKISKKDGDINTSLKDGDLTAKIYETDAEGNILEGDTTLVFNEELTFDSSEETFNFSLKLKDNPTIDRDKYVEIAFFTTQKRAFVLKITITHIYRVESEKLLTTQLESGNKYSFFNWNTSEYDGAIFKAPAQEGVVDMPETFDGVDIGIEGDVSTDDRGSIVLGEEHKYYYIANYNNIKYIEFAYLEEDKEFTFTAQFKKAGQNYSYKFKVKVQKSDVFTKNLGTYDFNKSETVKAFNKSQKLEENKIYGGIKYDFSLKEAVGSLTVDTALKFKLNGYRHTFNNNADTTNNDGTVTNINSDKLIIQPKYVSQDASTSLNLGVTYEFVGGYKTSTDETLAEKSVSVEKSLTVKYVASAGVKLQANYPMPDGKTKKTKEYITYSDEYYNDFFDKDSAIFAEKVEGKTLPRISIDNIAKYNEGSSTARDDGLNWTIEWSRLNNAIIIFNEKIFNEKSDPLIYQGRNAPKSTAFSNRWSFEGVDQTKEATIEFRITINGVPISYEITLTPESVIKAKRNFNNSMQLQNLSSDTEIIFAEDLANSEEQTLFEKDRLLKVTFNSSYLNRDISLVYENAAGERKYVDVTPETSTEMLIDAGLSLTDYEFKNVVDRTVHLKTDGSVDWVERGTTPLQDVFTKEPVKTQRIEINYIDGTPINQDGVDITLSRPMYIEWTYRNQLKNFGSSAEFVWSLAPEGVNKFGGKIDDVVYTQNVDLVVSDERYGFYLDPDFVAQYGGMDVTDMTVLKWSLRSGSQIQDMTRPSVFVPRKYVINEDSKACLTAYLPNSLPEQILSSDFNLTSQDFHKEMALKISVSLGSNRSVAIDSYYKIYLTADFQVINNSNRADDYYVIEAQAGETSKSLLADYNVYNAETGKRGFGISKLDGTNYDQTMMAREGKKFGLKIYGVTLPVASQDHLSMAAYNMNNNLRNSSRNENGKLLKYASGIRPYGGTDDLNEQGLFERKTYADLITISGVNQGVDSDSDYYIRPYGASNDGNYVMMRISYKVTFGDETISDEYNIMFKIVPNSDIMFRQTKGGNLNGAETREVDNYQTVHSNISTPYLVGEKDEYLRFFGNVSKPESEINSLESPMFVGMYGKSASEDGLKDFRFNLKMTNGEYNNWSDFEKTFITSDGGTGENVQSSGSDDFGVWSKGNVDGEYVANDFGSEETNVNLYIPEVKLGTKKFYIQLENEFGFKVRFYFEKVSAQNPVIASDGTDMVLTEGDTIVVGAQYSVIEPELVDSTTIRYNPFTYESYMDDDEKKYRNSLLYEIIGSTTSDELKDDNNKFESMLIRVTLATGQEKGAESLEITGEGSDAKASLIAGDVIYKTVKYENSQVSGSGTSYHELVNIYDKSSDWNLQYADSEGGSKTLTVKNLAQATLEGATIVVELKFKDTAKGTIYSLKYGDNGNYKYLTTNYQTRNIVNPDIQEYADDGKLIPHEERKRVTLSGVKAFAVENTPLGFVDINSVKENYLSSFNSLKVKSIDFYIGDTWVGGSKADKTLKTSITDGDKDSADKFASLYTSNEVSFIKADGDSFVTEAGLSYQADKDQKHFAVPYLNGILYQYPLNSVQVRMKITIVNGDYEAEIYQSVTIQRKATLDGVFENRAENGNYTIIDGNAPEVTSGFTGKIYSDTLEVVLPAHSQVSFAVNNTDFMKTAGNYVFNDGHPWISNDVDIKEISLSNDKDYAVTEYVSITNSMQDGVLAKNMMADNKDGFYLFVLDKSEGVSFRYNNTDISLTTKIDKDGKVLSTDSEDVLYYASGKTNIAQYVDTITLRIESDEEMSGYNYNHKMETLYFLYNAGETGIRYQNIDDENAQDGNSVYQFSANFEVYPTYVKGAQKAYSSPPRLKDYWKAENKAKNLTYYVIPLSSWGSLLDLTDAYDKVENLGALTNQPRQRFLFEISTGGPTGAGSAFIDDTGLITTNTNFDFSHTITVNVYQRVSGNDGKFVQKSKRVSLGSVTFMLDNNAKSAQNKTGGWIYSSTYASSPETVVLPVDYVLYTCYDSDSSNLPVLDHEYKLNEEFEDLQKSFAFTTSQPMNFHEMFDEKDGSFKNGANTYYNNTYHLVGYELNKEMTYVYYNNLDEYRLTQAGTYTLYFVVSSIYGTTSFKTTVTIYNDMTMTTRFVKVDKNLTGEVAGEGGYKYTPYSLTSLDSAEKWYEIKDGGNTELVEGNLIQLKENEGLVSRRFLAVYSDGSSKIYEVTFFVTEAKEQNKAAIVTAGGDFDLNQLDVSDLTEDFEKDLTDLTVKFYKNMNSSATNPQYEEINSTSFKNWQNNQRTSESYLLVIEGTNKDKQHVSVVYNLRVTYYITNLGSTETIDMVVPVEDETETDEETNQEIVTKTFVKSDDIKDKILKWLGLNLTKADYGDKFSQRNKFFYILIKDENGMLTPLGDSFDFKAGAMRGYSDFLIIYRETDGGTTQFRNVGINFYNYYRQKTSEGQPQDKIELSLFINDASYVYASSLYGEIRKAVGANAGVPVALYEFTNEQGNFVFNLDSVNRIVLYNSGRSFENVYYVLVGGKYYLIDLTLKTAKLDSLKIELTAQKDEFDLDNFKNLLINYKDDAEEDDVFKAGTEFGVYENLGEVLCEVDALKVPDENTINYYVITIDKPTIYRVTVNFTNIGVHIESGKTDKDGIISYIRSVYNDEKLEPRFYVDETFENEGDATEGFYVLASSRYFVFMPLKDDRDSVISGAYTIKDSDEVIYIKKDLTEKGTLYFEDGITNEKVAKLLEIKLSKDNFGESEIYLSSTFTKHHLDHYLDQEIIYVRDKTSVGYNYYKFTTTTLEMRDMIYSLQKSSSDSEIYNYVKGSLNARVGEDESYSNLTIYKNATYDDSSILAKAQGNSATFTSTSGLKNLVATLFDSEEKHLFIKVDHTIEIEADAGDSAPKTETTTLFICLNLNIVDRIEVYLAGSKISKEDFEQELSNSISQELGQSVNYSRLKFYDEYFSKESNKEELDYNALSTFYVRYLDKYFRIDKKAMEQKQINGLDSFIEDGTVKVTYNAWHDLVTTYSSYNIVRFFKYASIDFTILDENEPKTPVDAIGKAKEYEIVPDDQTNNSTLTLDFSEGYNSRFYIHCFNFEEELTSGDKKVYNITKHDIVLVEVVQEEFTEERPDEGQVVVKLDAYKDCDSILRKYIKNENKPSTINEANGEYDIVRFFKVSNKVFGDGLTDDEAKHPYEATTKTRKVDEIVPNKNGEFFVNYVKGETSYFFVHMLKLVEDTENLSGEGKVYKISEYKIIQVVINFN